jgi:hypothetical protein
MIIKPGMRLRSAADTTEVVVVRAPAHDTDLRCGGHPMLTADRPAEPQEVVAGQSAGTVVGKRYTDEAATLELLCVKAGAGSLSIGSETLTIKDMKVLPASD